jgi:uncharacterized protein YndB with AHSA1/START domain
LITENAVASEEVLIQAPVETVWQILVDFDNYGLWNVFCPQIKAELTMGSPVEMMTDLGNGLQEQVEYITEITPNKSIAWSMKNEPGDPVHACRTQRLNKVDEHSCTYFTIDEFSGEFMPAMLENFGTHIEAGFNRCAQGLKQFAEQQYSAQKA